MDINGNKVKKYYSDNNTKIQCYQDKNIYPVAYVDISSTITFVSTDIPLNEISSGMVIDPTCIAGLSDYIINTMDIASDGVDDDVIGVDLGGAS